MLSRKNISRRYFSISSYTHAKETLFRHWKPSGTIPLPSSFYTGHQTNYHHIIPPILHCRCYSSSLTNTEPPTTSSILGSPITLLQRPNLLRHLDKVHERTQSISRFCQENPFDEEDMKGKRKELSTLQPISELYQQICESKKALSELEAFQIENDPELLRMVAQEKIELTAKLEVLAQNLIELLLPATEEEECSAVLEIRAGVGGNEAALFTKELYEMYAEYADIHGWQWEETHQSISEAGGFKEASATITGRGVFRKLQFESGVHRVQRVPETENMGRMHTSAVTVAILPLYEEIQTIDIPPSDLRIDVFRASGPGGQHVNKTESAVRITHLPSGMAVSVQDERSQHRNKSKALKILKSKLLHISQRQQLDDRNSSKKQQMGLGDRSERIRTYHFPQNRVTDHRLQKAFHGIHTILNGERLNEVIDSLLFQDSLKKLENFGDINEAPKAIHK